MFFSPFQVFYTLRKQVYKLELFNKREIHDVFYKSLLEQNIIRKGRINEELPKLKKEFEARDNKEYEVEAIINNIVYGKEANN